MRTRRLLAVLVVVSAMLLAGCTTKVVTGDGTQPLNTVTAQGSGTAASAPDVAQMSFGVVVQDDDAKAALNGASEIAETISAAIKNAGVKSEDVQTANVSIYPQYDYRDGKAPTILGYEASLSVRAKVRDLAKVGEVIAAAVNAGANNVGGPSFTIEDDAYVRAEAIEDAVEDARVRAEAMAKASGKTVGEVIAISETGVTVPQLYTTRSALAEDQAASVPIEPGQLDVSASVTVVFELK